MSSSSSGPDKITPNDPRVEHHTFTTSSNKTTYHYLLANTPAPPTGTVLLVHGWPDLSFGWRYQITALLALNLRVVVPDMLGYGRTDAPEPLHLYSLKHVSADLAELMASVLGSPNQKFIIGGHDWGGFLVWRFVLYHPQLVQGVFSVCTPYSPPRTAYVDLETLVNKFAPTFKYQLQLAGPHVEREVVGEKRVRTFVNGMFGGRTSDGQHLFSTEKGINFGVLEKGIGECPLLSKEEVDFYVQEYGRRGDKPLRGPLNWYRTTKIKFDEELPLAQAGVGGPEKKVGPPAMIVVATKDIALPPQMSKNMEHYFERLTIRTVNTSHWALLEDPKAVNGHIAEFVTAVLEGEKPAIKASI
ncbi:Alpha/Beta hydrolase protein [Apodospora peruviana]|uniref:Alpha/Beta hydrolase protein n=1 Tax=Apodospora peruviana TaxID=516989 RepID=A0AAE0IBQ7_9PEZI|nr:Alpha/Beta hydrolase protein [Apodospora peruviana]